MQKEKVRVYALARELDMESKDLLDLCRNAGLDLKNQLSSLEPHEKDMVVDLVKRGGGAAVATAAKPAPVIPPVHKKSVRNLSARSRHSQEGSRVAASPAVERAAPADRTERGAPPAEPAARIEPEQPDETPTSVEYRSGTEEDEFSEEAAAKEADVEAFDESAGVGKAPSETSSSSAAESTEDSSAEGQSGAEAAAKSPLGYSTAMPGVPPEKKIRDLDGPKGGKESKSRPASKTGRPTPHNIPAPPPPKKSFRVKEPKKKQEKTQTPVQRLTKEQLEDARIKVIRPEDILDPSKSRGVLSPFETDDEEMGGKSKDKRRRGGAVGDRQKRKEARERRAQERRQQGQLDRQFDEDEDQGRRRAFGPRREKKGKSVQVQPRQGRVAVELPITVRSLSEALGMKSVQLLFRLRDHGLQSSVNINSTIEPEIAEEIAFDSGCEIEIKRPPDVEEQLLQEYDKPDDPDSLVPRAPVVTVMGHVDHGKTSLLDRIRQSNVVDTEAGGITQVIRAWRVEHEGRPITFLDTPGHEAFTQMRARGAQVTDIAVIVVAADDGIMPQTEEAISHAKAAGVSLVIAINKVDLPNANVDKTRQQLYSLEILPDNMGGDTPFVETSAATGAGLDELLEAISLVAELKELKANPNKSATGVCLEAMLSEGEGVLATLLVQQGTLNKGDVILCGASYGRIRQMYNDFGKPIEYAGPSVPVRVTGLDEVPNADDRFLAVSDLSTARFIADKRRIRQRDAAHVARTPFDLMQLSGTPIEKLNVIVKADFRGSLEAIRKELEKLKHDEVKVNVLLAQTGGISESDVQLALASPHDTMIVGFNVVPDDRAKSLAEERGIPIREYNVIYMLTDDVKAALEGKLKPRQEIIHLGRAVVRDTFKISKVGTIAGCYVTQGIIKRSAKVRLIREGAVIYPPPERTAGLDSLKRFKDDVAEVREGFECGIKIAGYDDVKVDDVIEAYRIEEVQRTLDQS